MLDSNIRKEVEQNKQTTSQKETKEDDTMVIHDAGGCERNRKP